MKHFDQLIFLVKLALNNEKTSDVSAEELRETLGLAEKHMISCLVSSAVDLSGEDGEFLRQTIGKATTKLILVNNEKEKVFLELEKAGIWHAPLKGMVLKDYYPKSIMREMSDCDVLFDADKAEEVKGIMEGLGFKVISYGEEHHDVYAKPPVTNVEMHRTLFQERHQAYEYYLNVKSKLILDEGSHYRYHFSPEDFYVYVMSHEYVHFAYYPGTGIRSLVDTFVFLRKWKDQLDWNYIEKECQKLEIEDFEKKNRQLSLRLFGDEKMTKEDEQFLQYFLTEGVYGSTEDGVNYKVDALGGGGFGKLRYVVKRLFPSMRWIKQRMPFIYRHKILLPAVPFIRIWQALTSKQKVAFNELQEVIKKK